MPALIHLYGPFGVTAEDGSTLDVSLRGAAILAVLAMAGDAGVGRERLAGLIWCDRGEAQARASLRQELSTLRRLVPAVCADRQRVWLDLGLIQVAQPEGAAEFLDGFALRSGAFDDWLRDTRLRDRGTRVGAATEAAQAALAAGNWSAAREAAQDALAIDPLGEAAARVLIRAEAQLGNRSAALTAFQRLEDALRAELDVAPDAQTRALVREVRREVHPTTKPQGARSADRRPVLAVLPFEALGTAGSDVLADGLVEEITGALSRTDAFDVIARQSAFALGESARDAHAAAAQLGADYLVEGTFQRAGNRLRLSVQLVAGESGLTHWSERFDDELDDLFDVQDRVAAQVAGHLAPHLRSAEIARAHRTPKADRNAYDQVLSALPHFWAHRREENAMAIWHLEAALAEKPKHPLALGYMAWASAQLCTYQWSSDIDRDRADAMDYITRGGLVAGDSPAVLTALAAALSLLNEDFPLARRYVDRALALDPNNAWAWMRSGWLAVYEGATDKALAEFDRAEELSPLDPFRFNIHFGRASALRQYQRYEDALSEVEAGLREGPGVVWALRMLAGGHEMLGQHDKALEAMRQWRAHYPDLSAEMAKKSLPRWQHERPYIECIYRLIDEVWSA